MVMNKENNFISVVLYIYNNEEQISIFLKRLYNILNDKFRRFEIILVNDCSTDKSIEKIKTFASMINDSIFSIINMSVYQGIELSMNAGVDLSIGDFVFEFDNLHMDYSDNIIMDVYYHSLKGFDIVSASPESMKIISSRFFYSVFNKYSNNPYKLRTESFRVLSRRAINRIHSISKTIPYRKAVYSSSGLKIDTILYKQIVNSNIKGSTETAKVRLSTAIDSLILFTDVAYKMSLALTFIMAFLTIFVAGYTVVVYLGQKPVTGWTTTMLFLSISFFGVYLVFAIIIKYLSILIDLVFKKQQYLIESIEKITK